jgi:hypothetical protein
MKRRVASAIGVLLAVTLSAGALVASNMGHMATVRLYSATSGVSYSGTNTVNLPYYLGPNILNAKDLMDDIGFASVINVQRFLKLTDSLQVYTGRKNGGVGFTLTPGECYKVQMSATTDYTVVGSHVPTQVVTLNAYETGVSASGTNWVSLPFNITARNAKELMDDIGFANVYSVSRFLRASDSLQTYTGRKNGGTAFPISYDECYLIKMNTTVNYIPSHY